MKLRDLIFYKAYAELRRDVASSYLGVLWWVLEPLLYLAAFYSIFALGIKTGGENFVAFLLCGLAPWKWYSSAVTSSALSLISNKGLIQQVYIPKAVLPLIPLTVNFVKFLFIFIILLGLLVYLGHYPNIYWLYLIPIILLQFLFTLGCALILSAVVPFFLDLKVLIGHAILMLMFVSGIFFNVQDFSEEVRNYFYLNPLVPIIQSYRNVLIYAAAPDVSQLMRVAFVSCLLCLTGLSLLIKYDKQYPKVIV